MLDKKRKYAELGFNIYGIRYKQDGKLYNGGGVEVNAQGEPMKNNAAPEPQAAPATPQAAPVEPTDDFAESPRDGEKVYQKESVAKMARSKSGRDDHDIVAVDGGFVLRKAD